MKSSQRIANGFCCACLAVCALGASVEPQNLRELAREQAAKGLKTPLEMVGPPGDYRQKDLGDLAKESGVILRGTLNKASTYLGGNNDRILTDYNIQVQQLIAGSLPTRSPKVPSYVPPLVLAVYGGELSLEGILVRAIDPNRREILDGMSYLMFLMPSRRGETGYYEIYSGGMFEVSDDKVKPVLKDGDRIFKGIADTNLSEILVQVQSARRQ